MVTNVAKDARGKTEMTSVTAGLLTVVAAATSYFFFKELGGVFARPHVRLLASLVVAISFGGAASLFLRPEPTVESLLAEFKSVPMVGVVLKTIPATEEEIRPLLKAVADAQSSDERAAAFTELRKYFEELRQIYYSPALKRADAIAVKDIWRKQVAFLHLLKGRSKLCKEFLFGRPEVTTHLDNEASAALKEVIQAKDAAFLNGVNKDTTHPIASKEEFVALLKQKLTEEEQKNLIYRESAPDAAACNAGIKLYGAVSLLPDNQSLPFIRGFIDDSP